MGDTELAIENQPTALDHGPEIDGATVTDFFCHRAKDRLPDAPREFWIADG